jgi:hypothetical protein
VAEDECAGKGACAGGRRLTANEAVLLACCGILPELLALLIHVRLRSPSSDTTVPGLRTAAVLLAAVGGGVGRGEASPICKAARSLEMSSSSRSESA